MATYTRDHKREEWMRHRLKEAVQRLADGSAEKLGRLLGYTNGGFVREIVTGGKPVGKAVVARMEDVPGGRGWFNGAPGQAGVADVQVKYGHGRPTAAAPKTKRPLPDQALGLAVRFDALPDGRLKDALYAAMSALLDGFEAEQRHAERKGSTDKQATTPAGRARAQRPNPSR